MKDVKKITFDYTGGFISLGNADISKDRTLKMNQSYCQQMVTKKLNKQQL